MLKRGCTWQKLLEFRIAMYGYHDARHDGCSRLSHIAYLPALHTYRQTAEYETHQPHLAMLHSPTTKNLEQHIWGV